jgi:hypothetical protein
METVNQLILAKSVNIFRRKSSSEQTKQSTDSEIFKGSLRSNGINRLDNSTFEYIEHSFVSVKQNKIRQL